MSTRRKVKKRHFEGEPIATSATIQLATLLDALSEKALEAMLEARPRRLCVLGPRLQGEYRDAFEKEVVHRLSAELLARERRSREAHWRKF